MAGSKQFADAMKKVGTRVHLSLYEDETSALCHWQIPEAHFLESWSDVRADDGTVTIIQPLIAPLYDGKSAHEVVAALSGAERPAYDLVRAHWSGAKAAPPAAAPVAAGVVTAAAPAQAAAPAAPAPKAAGESSFDRGWRKWLHDGVVADTAFSPKTVTLKSDVGEIGRAHV